MADATQGTTKHLEFQNTIEGVLLRTLGTNLTPALRVKLKADGLDLDRPLLPAYPAADFHRWVKLASKDVWPNLAESEAVRSFGKSTLTGLSETVLGKAMKVTLGLLGPRRSLHRATRTFRSNNNYTEVVVVERAPNALEMSFNEVYGLPSYYQGVLEGGCLMMKAKNFRVNILPSEGTGARYLVEWDE